MQSNKGNGVLEDFPGRFLLSLEQEVCKVAVFCHCENTNDKSVLLISPSWFCQKILRGSRKF